MESLMTYKYPSFPPVKHDMQHENGGPWISSYGEHLINSTEYAFIDPDIRWVVARCLAESKLDMFYQTPPRTAFT